MRRIKLIWEFGGADSKKIAEHHVVHLNEYASREKLSETLAGIEEYTEFKTIAYFVVNEDVVFQVRDSLKPLRGEIYK